MFSFPQLLLECRPCEMAIETKRLCLCSCNVLFTRHQMFLQPTSTTSEPRVSLSSQFSIFAFGKGRHFLFYGSSTHFPGGAGLRGLMVSSSFAVGNQTHHQIGSSDSYGEYGVDQGELSLRKLFAMENQGKSNQRKRSWLLKRALSSVLSKRHQLVLDISNWKLVRINKFISSSVLLISFAN